MILIVDGDIVIYAAMSAAQEDLEFEPGQWILSCDHEEAFTILKKHIQKLMDKSNADDVLIALTDYSQPLFRKDIFPEYKANRKDTRKPLGFSKFVERVQEAYTCVKKPKLEADDVMGILGTKPSNIGKCVIWSDDKDLMQIPGLHLVKDDIVEVSEIDGDRWLFQQVLQGDAVDNYKGIPGVGPVKALKILESLDTKTELISAAIAAYEKAGLTYEDFMVQMQMAYILRWHSWDSEKQEVIKWSQET